ncbi:hypothetical protein AB0N38_10465 [Micromonospora aurantiaca]|uniref:hypothetical protein n=1 Tax=Micromonospora aurantiaca (nom. illeg.) TaxID=47850 RepID=UPI003436A5C8
MITPDWLAARIRTAWPMLLGYLAVQLLQLGAPVAGWLHSALGITLTAQQVAAVLGLVLGYGIYEAGRWLEARSGPGQLSRVARAAGRLLLSLGLDTGQPVYGLPPARTESVADLYPDGSPRQIRSTTVWPRRP